MSRQINSTQEISLFLRDSGLVYSQVIMLIPFWIQSALDDLCTVTLSTAINCDLGKWVWEFYTKPMHRDFIVNIIYEYRHCQEIHCDIINHIQWMLYQSTNYLLCVARV